MIGSSLFAEALGPEVGTAYRLSEAVAHAFAGKAVLEGLTETFDLDEFARAGRCVATTRGAPHPYHFDQPARTERAASLARWNVRLAPALRVTKEQVERLADDTEGFSFAYLEELYVASVARWVRTAAPGGMHAVLREQLQVLREQSSSTGRA